MAAAQTAEVLEVIMIILFGASWPFNVVKSYRARTAEGKSLSFLIIILVAYLVGIVAKIILFNADEWIKWLALAVYILNFIMVSLDFLLYVRNRRLDRKNAKNSQNVNES